MATDSQTLRLADGRMLADHLGLAQFVIMVVSAGGPYVAACAYNLPERITAADDSSVPVSMGRYLEQYIPNTVPHFLPGGGHFAWVTFWREILAGLVGFVEADE